MVFPVSAAQAGIDVLIYCMMQYIWRHEAKASMPAGAGMTVRRAGGIVICHHPCWTTICEKAEPRAGKGGIIIRLPTMLAPVCDAPVCDAPAFAPNSTRA